MSTSRARPNTPRVARTRVMSWIVECPGSAWAMIARHSGQEWVYLLNPGKQGTRQLRIQDPRRQQMIAYVQPEQEILLEIFVWTFC